MPRSAGAIRHRPNVALGIAPSPGIQRAMPAGRFGGFGRSNRKRQSFMKTALILLLSLTTAMFAANPKKDSGDDRTSRQQAGQEEVKKLGSLTWDLNAHKLVWVVQK